MKALALRLQKNKSRILCVFLFVLSAKGVSLGSVFNQDGRFDKVVKKEFWSLNKKISEVKKGWTSVKIPKNTIC